MRRVLTVLGAVLLIATLGFALALYRDASLQRGRILPGVSINGIPVGGLTPAAAKVRIEAVVAERLAQTLGIRAGGQIWRPTLADLGVHGDLDDAVAEAFALGRETNPFRRLETRWRLRSGINVLLRFSRRDDEAIRAVVARIAGEVTTEPRDAEVTVVDGAVVLTQAGVLGRVVEVEETVERIRSAITQGQREIEAAVVVRRPRFTTEAALAITAPIARYTTRFVNIPNRNHNIALAAGKLRGVLILPGEVLSFNAAVGPRTPQEGYLPAPVLINNTLVPGDGGGVCQVSSTLFNTALLADLSILERSNHTRPVAYLPIGRDATVVYGALDLRFQNTTGHPLLLWSTVRGLRLAITVYGPAQPRGEVAIIVGERRVIPPPGHTVTRSDPELDAGTTVIEAAKPGYRVRTYRVVRRDGVVVKRELIGGSFYHPVPRTVRVGTRPVTDARAPAP